MFGVSGENGGLSMYRSGSKDEDYDAGLDRDDLFERFTSETTIAVPEGSISMTKHRRPNWLKETMENGMAKRILIYLCFWVSSVGTFFGWFSMSATFFHWSQLYSEAVLLYMTSAYSFPAFFIQLLQARFDFRINKRFGKIRAFKARMVLLLSILITCIALMPFLPHNIVALLALVLLMGVVSSAAYGTLFQLVALYPKRATSFLSLGYASPGVLLLFLSFLVFGDPAEATQNRIFLFFGIVTGVILLGLLSFLFLLWISTSQLQEVKYRTIPKDYRRINPVNVVHKEKESPDNIKILKQIWASCIGVAMLMFSRLTVYTTLPYVPANDVLQSVFSQRLLYINLGADLGGRFLTVIAPRLPERYAPSLLLMIVLIHFSTLNPYLLYVYGEDIIPHHDLLVQIVLALFATTTGFVQTNLYAYAAFGIEDKFKTQVGALMNLFTQLGNASGLAFSFLLKFIFK